MRSNHQIIFPPFRLDRLGQRVCRGDETIALRPKAFAVLIYLLERHDRLVTKNELLDACWPETAVSDTVLKVCIREIREALGDDSQSPRFIKTAHRRGYHFIGQIAEDGETERTIAESLPLSVSPSLRLSLSGPHHLSGAFRLAALLPAKEMVGREGALAQMRIWLERAMRGERQVVFVTGEAGIGKTTLVEAWLRGIARDAGILIAQGQCLEQYGASEAFFPVLEAVSRLCQERGGERAVGLLRHRAPTWIQEMPWLAGDADREALQREAMGATRERMLREMAESLEALTSETTLVLALEDLHWSDYSTLDLISYLARRRGRAQLLFIGTYRPVELALSDHPLKAVKQELQVKRQCEELPLEYLSEDEVGEYLAARFPQNQFPDELTRLIHARTEGNPLFMAGVADYLRDEGLIAEFDGRWRLRVELAELEVGAPESIRQMIERQIEALGSQAQRVLEAASVAGAEFSAAAVAAGLSEDALWVEEQCEQLQRRRQFIRALGAGESPDGTMPAHYGFIHALYQNVLYDRLAPARRAQLHLTIGEHDEAAYGGRAVEIAAELAMHFECGRDPSRAAKYLRQAAENAARRFANHEAIALARRGLDLLNSQPNTVERMQSELPLQVILGVTLMATRGYAAAEVEQAYARARELCRQMGETPQLFPVLWGLTRFYIVRTPLQTARELAEQLLRIAQRERSPYLLMQACNLLADCLFHLGEFIQARAYLEQGVALEVAPPQPQFDVSYVDDPRVVCLVRLALVLWCLGYPEQGLNRCRAALALAEELAHPFTLVIAQVFAATFHLLRRDYRATRELAEAALAISVQQGFNELTMHAGFMCGCALVEQGQIEEGTEHILRSANAAQQAGVEIWRPSVLGVLAQASGETGLIEKGLSLFDEALAAAARSNERFAEAELYRLKGELLLKVENRGSRIEDGRSRIGGHNPRSSILDPRSLSSPEACFHRTIETARRQEAKSWELRAVMSLAHLYRRQGRQAEARQMLSEVYDWFTEGFDTADLKDARALLDELS